MPASSEIPGISGLGKALAGAADEVLNLTAGADSLFRLIVLPLDHFMAAAPPGSWRRL